jgi:hypothetical protein
MMTDLMKRTSLFLLSALVLLILVGIWIHARLPAPVRVAPLPHANEADQSSPTTSQGLEQPNSPGSPRETARLGTSAVAASREERWQVALNERNVPINFWGKVVDETGAPLGGVSIALSSRTFLAATNLTGFTLHPRTNALTGNDGLFEIHGMSGDSLKIEAFDKEDYEPEPGASRVFTRESLLAVGPNNPVVFRLWKRGLKQALIAGDKVFHFVPDGRRYAINLTDGIVGEAKATEGDLQFWAQRPPSAHRRQPYDWSFSLQAPDGGLLRELVSQYADMSLAPEAGYTNLYQSLHHSDDLPWDDGEGQHRFYVALHGGRACARIQISVNSFDDPKTGEGRLHIEYALNPSGSRILR